MKITDCRVASRQRGLVSLGLISLLAAGAAPIARGENPPVQMERFTVNDKHLLCFGIALTLWENKNTHQVMAMYVKQVQPDSMAEEKGLRPGTRIWTIDGVPVEDFPASFAPENELGKKFLNRKRGETIVLEISVEGERRTQFVELTQSPLRITVREVPPTK